MPTAFLFLSVTAMIMYQARGLLAISSYDYVGYGMFCADIISSIFNGQKAGDCPVSIQAPPIYLLIWMWRNRLIFSTILTFY
jgi:ABC-type uncharacterized transport system substrate-binding protein